MDAINILAHITLLSHFIIIGFNNSISFPFLHQKLFNLKVELLVLSPYKI